jgi:signal transduction histidine kinase
MASQLMPQPVARPSAGLVPSRQPTEPVSVAIRLRSPDGRPATPPEELFRTVTRELGRLLSVDFTALSRFDSDTETLVATWSRSGEPGGDVSLRGCVSVPVKVGGGLWGLVYAASAGEEPLPADTAARLAGFTDLVAAAIGNAEAQAELLASRARIAAAADETRRRIERDLHDGAQQRLISLALRLKAAQAAVPAGLDGLRDELGHLAAGLTSTADELRDYARGIRPAILSDGGLAAALKSLAYRSPVPVRLEVGTSARLPERVEVALYYVAAEALANAAKHAHAAEIAVTVDEACGIARLSVSDDGVGGADPACGSGLVGLQDRVAAAGGTLKVRSSPGKGTHLAVELPVCGQAGRIRTGDLRDPKDSAVM